MQKSFVYARGEACMHVPSHALDQFKTCTYVWYIIVYTVPAPLKISSDASSNGWASLFSSAAIWNWKKTDVGKEKLVLRIIQVHVMYDSYKYHTWSIPGTAVYVCLDFSPFRLLPNNTCHTLKWTRRRNWGFLYIIQHALSAGLFQCNRSSCVKEHVLSSGEDWLLLVPLLEESVKYSPVLRYFCHRLILLYSWPFSPKNVSSSAGVAWGSWTSAGEAPRPRRGEIENII